MDFSTFLTLLLFLHIYSSSAYFTQQDGNLTCNATSMSIEFDVVKLISRGRPFKIHFQNANLTEAKNSSGSSCMLQYNGTEDMTNKTLILEANFNECGIDIYQQNGFIVYNQTVLVSFGENPKSSPVYRLEEVAFKVGCKKSNNLTVNLDGYFNVTSTLKREVISVDANANFDIRLFRTQDDTYTQEEFSSSLTLGNMIYFKIQLSSVRNDLKISPQSCYATNTQNSAERYYLIQNKCENPSDSTVKISSQASPTIFQWKNEAFRFFNASDSVYITCNVFICESSTMVQACDRCGQWSGRKRRGLDLTELGNNEKVETATIKSPIYILLDPVKLDDYRTKFTPLQSKDETNLFAGVKGSIILVLSMLLVIIMATLLVKKILEKRNCFGVSEEAT